MFGISREYLKILLLIACAVFILTVLLLFFDIWRENVASKRDKTYIYYFMTTLEETNNLKQTLEKVLALYSPKAREYQAVKRALDYLDHSIYGDYETAAWMIEEALYNKKIHETHQLAIQICIKKLSQAALEDKNTFEI